MSRIVWSAIASSNAKKEALTAQGHPLKRLQSQHYVTQPAGKGYLSVSLAYCSGVSLKNTPPLPVSIA
jgi:hypothetical protein